MIIAHLPAGAAAADARCHFERRILGPSDPVPADAVWLDLIEPTREEDRRVELALGIEIPTREESQNIEPSEVLYFENDARYMSARILCQSGTESPKLAAISFILKGRVLVTVRYDEPRSFQMFINRLQRPGAALADGDHILIALFETVIDRAAEILRLTGERIDDVSAAIFDGAAPRGGGDQLRTTLQLMGAEGNRISKVRESLVSVERMLLFLSANTAGAVLRDDLRAEVRTTLRDLQSLEDHATFLSSKIQFLLDAVLGLVNLDQNKIIKIFSVAAVVFLPPTLIASSYGMNFKNMPELEWQYGYPLALGLMVLSAAATYLFFKMKRWL
ncbi:MAG: magnesium transporter CorA family protein [Hyphomicrobiales bacterium]|uniref:magnesium transporter CorA family protein n=1 Tax=Rhabdaerophilum calidifontis TaxID=2604328 RepID=UPI00123B5AA9|nr:magnesium transporter CorA family protein [Rhabdaerophilum calidifontis]MCA1953163.1 magnesium transporter CorA family protein [Hyphomicrobiales bacterium]